MAKNSVSFTLVSLVIFISFVLSVLVIFFSVSVYLHMTGGPLSTAEKIVHDQLRFAIESREKLLNVNALLPSVEWKRVCYIHPYETEKTVELELGLELGYFDWPMAWSDNDGFWSLVFVTDKKIIPVRIRTVEIASEPSESSERCVERKSGYLEITSEGKSGRRIDLR